MNERSVAENRSAGLNFTILPSQGAAPFLIEFIGCSYLARMFRLYGVA